MTPAAHDNDNGLRDVDLQAYVDGQLDLRQLASVEAYLAAHPGDAARVAAYRLQIAGLHTLFGPRPGTASARTALPPAIAVLACELDAHLRQPVATATRPRHRARGAARGLVAAVVLLLAAGVAAGLALTQSVRRDDPLVAFSRHVIASPLQPASGQRHYALGLAVQPGRAPLQAPNLEALGFRLVAERVIDAHTGRPATQLLYQDAGGQRVTLSMRAGGKAGHSSFTFKRNGEAAQFLWQDENMAYGLIGRMDETRLLSIAEAVSRSLRGTAEQSPAPEAAAPPASLESAVQSSPAASGGRKVRGAEAPASAVDPAIQSPRPPPQQIEIPKDT